MPIQPLQAAHVLLHLADGVLIVPVAFLRPQRTRGLVFDHKPIVNRVSPPVDQRALAFQAEADVKVLGKALDDALGIGDEVRFDTRSLRCRTELLGDFGRAPPDESL